MKSQKPKSQIGDGFAHMWDYIAFKKKVDKRRLRKKIARKSRQRNRRAS